MCGKRCFINLTQVHIPTRPDIFHCFHCPDIETSLNEWHIRMQLNSTHPHSYVQLSIFLIGYLAQIALPSPYSRIGRQFLLIHFPMFQYAPEYFQICQIPPPSPPPPNFSWFFLHVLKHYPMIYSVPKYFQKSRLVSINLVLINDT